MKTLNIPIQLISACSTLGDFTPLRFRYEDSVHQIHTIHIEQIHSTKFCKIAGIDSISYTCSAIIDHVSTLFILRYYIESHKWILYQILT